VVLRGLYPHIDLSYQIDQGALEYSLLLSPGADPRHVRARFSQPYHVSTDASGDLIIANGRSALRQKHLRAFQLQNGTPVPVSVAFHVSEDGIVALQLGRYDSRLPLMIEPARDSSSGFGAVGWDGQYAVASDAGGNIYLTGETPSLDLLRGSGAPSGTSAARDVLVTRIWNGSLQYTTILASSGTNSGRSIAVNASGTVYIAGVAGADDFPVTSDAVQTIFGGEQDAFVARLDPTGRLVYSTFLGGSSSDIASGIAVDRTDSIYVTGCTASSDFFTHADVPRHSKQGGLCNAFVVKMGALGTKISYSTLLGGEGNDFATGIAVDDQGNAVIAGFTDSIQFPVHNAFQSQNGGNGDAFVASLNPSGTAWNYVTYLGGSAADQANSITVDSAGAAYITVSNPVRDLSGYCRGTPGYKGWRLRCIYCKVD